MDGTKNDREKKPKASGVNSRGAVVSVQSRCLKTKKVDRIRARPVLNLLG